MTPVTTHHRASLRRGRTRARIAATAAWTRASLVAAVLLALSAACDDSASPSGPSEPESSFTATVTGAEETSFQATGYYMVGPAPELPFSLSASIGRPDGSGHGFLIFGNGGVPGLGTHPLGLDPAGLRATYTIAADGANLVAYTAADGEVVITAATDTRIEGTFQFTAFRYCHIENGELEGPCKVPDAAIAGVPQIDVTGSFSAIDHYSIPILEVVRPATIQFYQEPVVIEAPASVTRGQRFTVRVRSYGDGCTSFERTDVAISGRVAVVAPYDRERTGGACTQQLVSVEHTAELVFASSGTARIVFRGRKQPGGEAVDFVKEVVVR